MKLLMENFKLEAYIVKQLTRPEVSIDSHKIIQVTWQQWVFIIAIQHTIESLRQHANSPHT